MARLVTIVSLLGAYLLGGQPLLAAEEGYAPQGYKQCLSCHDYGDQSPVHPLLETVHGKKDKEGSPMAERGCESCHGPSAAHADAPTQRSPGISFGPRWNSGLEAQDEQCLDCHQDSIGGQWQQGVHAEEKLSCTTCHDAHTSQDKAMGETTQAEVCEVCHKPQKSGIHAMADKLADNPPCSSCHLSHGNPSAKLLMLHNRSTGCNQCHDLVAMSKDPAVSPKATSYHRTMTRQDRTCIDCHQGIAHAPADSVAPLVAQAVSKKTVTLFSPGQSDSNWLLTEHPGSQPLRQGRDCEQCHQGEEANMGAKLAAEGSTATRDVSIAFAQQQGQLVVNLSWRGDAGDQQVALMWGDDGNEAFQRGACWAACHSDMPGMSRDRGQGLSKYLSVSRSQQQAIGKPPQPQPRSELDKLMAAGNFAELWRIRLGAETTIADSAVVLQETDWQQQGDLAGTASYRDGRWSVTFKRPLAGSARQKSFIAGKRYTFGVALQGAGQAASAHWVSLPLTFSLDDKDTDFISAK